MLFQLVTPELLLLKNPPYYFPSITRQVFTLQSIFISIIFNLNT